MAASIIKGCSVFVDGYDLSCAFKQAGVQKAAGEVDTTAVCTTGDLSFVPGLKQGTATLSGMYDYDATDQDELENILDTAFDSQTDLILSFTLGTISVGGEAWMIRGGQMQKDVQNALAQLIMTNATIRAKGNAFRGAVLFNSAVDDTAEVGSSVDNAAATTNGGILHFHVHTPDGDITEAEILVEHSTDNSSWVTLISTQALGAGFGAIAVEVAQGTTVRRYLRATVTTTDGEATAVAAFHRYAA
jgi:hypothetical protein